MSLVALLAVKAKLESNAELAEHCQSVFGKNATHAIGYKKPASANDYPVICYTPVKSTRTFAGDVDSVVSIVIGINAGLGTDGKQGSVADGIIKLDALGNVVLNGINNLINNYLYSLKIYDGFEIVSDMAMGHPFHEIEIIFTVKSKRR